MKQLLKRFQSNQRGDTLVEVLVATVILTVVLAGAYTVVNRSTRINQTAIERTEVANQLAEQAELLRAMRDTNGLPTSTWPAIRTAISGIGLISDLDCNDSVDGFYLETDKANLGNVQTVTRAAGANLGGMSDAYPDIFDVWIVAEQSPNQKPGKPETNQYDFHIRGCWEGIGSTGDQRAEIIVRLRR